MVLNGRKTVASNSKHHILCKKDPWNGMKFWLNSDKNGKPPNACFPFSEFKKNIPPSRCQPQGLSGSRFRHDQTCIV